MEDEKKSNKERECVDVKAKSSVGYGSGGGMGYWHFAKPFVEGGSAKLLGGFLVALLRVNDTKFKMPLGYVTETLSSAALIGSYENIRQAAIFANEQKPLSWFQEANCGLIAGAIGACVFVPTGKVECVLQLVATSRAARPARQKNAYHVISRMLATEGILGLWKTEHRILGRRTIHLTAMLTSYNQGFAYFKNCQSSNDFNAHLGATAISGLITPLLTYPHNEANKYRQVLIKKNTGRSYHNTSTLVLAMEIIRLGGLSSFCCNLPTFVCHEAASIMAFLLSLYFIRHL